MQERTNDLPHLISLIVSKVFKLLTTKYFPPSTDGDKLHDFLMNRTRRIAHNLFTLDAPVPIHRPVHTKIDRACYFNILKLLHF
jgi:hypothetical protein